VLVVGAPFTTSGSDFVWIAVLAIVTGLVALSLYYYGLKRTPAVIATLAELTVSRHRRHGRLPRVRRDARRVAVARAVH
jgi:hypothetical protein